MQVVVSKEFTSDDAIRVTGRIESAEGTRAVWFDLPADLDGVVASSGNAWLILMLPFAIQTGERIDLALPVDPLLLENARQLVATWVGWYPELAQCEICAPTQRTAISEGQVAQFFSGGVDAWFTLLRHAESSPRFPQVGDVDDLITVGGLDIPVGKVEEFIQLANSARGIAREFGKRHVVVRTNLRANMSGSWKSAWGPRWGSLSHVAALAAIGLLIERRYARVLIGSTGLGTLPPWGSHPLTDVLCSTSTTVFQHDHAVYSRAEKLERIAESPYAVSRLKVCFTAGTFSNCSVCTKCHRTLLCLDILGVLDHARSFDVAAYLRNRHRPILVWTEIDRALALGVRDLALRHSRSDIAALIEDSINRSRRIKSITEPIRKVSWRAWQAAYRKLARDMIGA